MHLCMFGEASAEGIDKLTITRKHKNTAHKLQKDVNLRRKPGSNSGGYRLSKLCKYKCAQLWMNRKDYFKGYSEIPVESCGLRISSPIGRILPGLSFVNPMQNKALQSSPALCMVIVH